MTELNELPDEARKIVNALMENGFGANIIMGQMMCLTEEVGEFEGAYRRYAGMARRTGPWSDVEQELADVIITAFCTADVIGLDLPQAIDDKLKVIFTRGWRERTTAEEVAVYYLDDAATPTTQPGRDSR